MAGPHPDGRERRRDQGSGPFLSDVSQPKPTVFARQVTPLTTRDVDSGIPRVPVRLIPIRYSGSYDASSLAANTETRSIDDRVPAEFPGRSQLRAVFDSRRVPRYHPRV